MSEFYRRDELIKQVEHMNEYQLIEWIYFNSEHKDIYVKRLPSGLEYVSGPQEANCFAFATRGRTTGPIEADKLIPVKSPSKAI